MSDAGILDSVRILRHRAMAMAAIFLLALVARTALVATYDPTDMHFSDKSYIQYAKNLHDKHEFFMEGPYGVAGPDKVYAFRPPLFPFVWGLLYGVTRGSYVPMWFGFAVLSSIGCVLIYRVGLRLFPDERAAAIGGLICAVYPPLIYFGVNLVTEPFFIFLSVLTMLFLFRAWDSGHKLDAGLAGVWFGLGMLSRSVLIGFAPVIAIWLLFRPVEMYERNGKLRANWALAACFAGALVLTLTPWVVRNALVLDSFVVSTTDGGHGFYVANNSQSLRDPRGFYMPGDWRFVLRPGEKQIGEVEMQRRLTAEALHYSTTHPGEWLRLVARRAVWFWRPWPHEEFVGGKQTVVYALSFLPLVPFILIGLVLAHARRRNYLGKYLLIDFLILYTWAIHSVILATLRYREPLMPFLILFAGLAISSLFLKGPRRSKAGEFDEIAGEYDRSLPEHVQQHYLRKRVRLFGREFGGNSPELLDVGSGTGVLMEAMQATGAKVRGVDCSAGMLRIAKEQRDCSVVRSSSGMLPFADSSFDGAYCVALLHHLREPQLVADTVREMVRVTRPGGRIIIWDHNPSNPYWPVIMSKVPQDTGDERLVPESEIRSALRERGVTEVRVIKSGFVPEFVPRWMMPLAVVVEKIVEVTPVLRKLAAHNVVIATKGG